MEIGSTITNCIVTPFMNEREADPIDARNLNNKRVASYLSCLQSAYCIDGSFLLDALLFA